ncbi:HD domain-containing protein [Stappia stellulata]|uniref:HD-GYP domain-containing protein n=1 Tax=Stappia stellulata TaxID=71235 RepID=UPI001CD322B7|nr:HD domain-containing phosphohydrolase [Stappia stellulata]MCA1244861.1 HD domain-containing protein [Stappia stellulata]
MIDVLFVLDDKTEVPAIVNKAAAMFSVARIPASDIKPDHVARARVVVVHAALRSVGHVERIEQASDETRRREDCIYVAKGIDRAGIVQAESIGIGRVFAAHQPLDDVFTAIQAILNRELSNKLTGHPASVVQAVETTDTLVRQVAAAMRADAPLPLRLLSASSQSIGVAVGSGGLMQWINAVELHHSQTSRHIMMVAGYADAFARTLGLSGSDTALFTEASLLHDVGKLFIPISILEKAGPLSDAERKAIMTHPLRGAKALKRDNAAHPLVIAAARSHHEYLDGSGYPDKLAGDQISPLVRMLTIVDIYSALTEERAYKAAMTPRLAITQMAGMKGKLDARLFAAFRDMVLNPVFGSQRSARSAENGPVQDCLANGIHPLDCGVFSHTAGQRAAG